MSAPERVQIGNAERKVWIYALCDPHTDEPRYIGKTARSPLARLREHKALAKRSRRLPVQRWLNAVAGVKLAGAYMRILEVADSQTWESRERHWIAHGRLKGWRLLNLTEGGEGLHGLVQSEEHRRKNSEANKRGRFFKCYCGKDFWRKPGEIAKGNARFCSKTCYQRSLVGVSKPMPPTATARGVKAARALKLAQLECKRGHPLSGGNLFVTSNGSRGCKECRKGHKRAYLARIKR